MDTVKTLKTEYNKVLEQWNKATEYLESKERAASEVDKWLPKYEDILKQRNALCMDIWQKSGTKPTAEEFENGFIWLPTNTYKE